MELDPRRRSADRSDRIDPRVGRQDGERSTDVVDCHGRHVFDESPELVGEVADRSRRHAGFVVPVGQPAARVCLRLIDEAPDGVYRVFAGGLLPAPAVPKDGATLAFDDELADRVGAGVRRAG